MAAAIQVASLFGTLRLDKSAFEKDVQGAGGMFDSLGSVAGKAGKAIAAGVTIGAAAITGLSIAGINAAMDWETAFAGVKKTMDTVGMSAEEEAAFFKGLEDQLRSMAKEIPIAHQQLAAIAEAAGALGVKAEDIEEFTRTAALLGVTTDVSGDQAATALGKINAVLPFTKGEFERFGNTLVDLGNKGASTESEIVEMAQRMSGAAALVGLSKPQLLAWASAAANVGIRAEAGGSSFQKFALGVNSMTSSTGKLRQASVLGNVSIKAILASATKGPKAFGEMAAKLGMTTGQLRKLINQSDQLDRLADVAGMTAKEFTKLYNEDASAALQKVVNGLAGMSKAQKQATLEALGFKDIRITQYLLTLSANTDNLNDSLANGATAWEENAAMTEEARKRFETTESKIALLKNVANDAAITFGNALLPAIGDIVEKASGLITTLGDWMSANSELMDTFAPIIAGIAGIISTLAGASVLGNVLGPVAPMLGSIGKAAGLLLSPLGLAAAAIIGLGLLFGVDFDDVREVARELLPKLKGVLDDIRALVDKHVVPALQDMSRAFSDILGFGSEAQAQLAGIAVAVGVLAIAAYAHPIIALVAAIAALSVVGAIAVKEDWLGQLADQAVGARDRIANGDPVDLLERGLLGLDGLVKSLAEPLGGFLDNVATTWRAAGEVISGDFSNLGSMLIGIAQFVMSSILIPFQIGWGLIQAGFDQLGIDVGGIVEDMADTIRDTLRGAQGVIEDVMDAIGVAIGDTITAASPIIDGFGILIDNVAKAIGDSLGNVRDAFDSLVPLLRGVWNKVVETIRKAVNLIIDMLNGVSQAFAFQIKLDLPSFDVPDPTQLLEGGTIKVGGGSVDWSRGPLFDKIPHFDVGAWRIPDDMLAVIHRGEMVVPEAAAAEIRAGRTTSDWDGLAAAGRGVGGPLIGHQTINGVQPGDVEIETGRALRRAALSWAFGG